MERNEYKKDDENIKLFNKIISQSTQYDDYQKCSEIKNDSDLKENCIAQIKFKFDEMNLAKNSGDCKKLTDKDGKTATQRQDICFLNLNYKLPISQEDEKYCQEIKDQDLKNLCISQNNLKN